MKRRQLASRVATHATPHQYWPPAPLERRSARLRVTFSPLGKRRLKGLAEDLELFEVRSEGWPAR
ncbi:MAG TPA: hypothetical protein VLB49_03915 [Gemmatimonadales bacterium]|nr:hypothetical protein [Gemmatimonadales bacterium]